MPLNSYPVQSIVARHFSDAREKSGNSGRPSLAQLQFVDKLIGPHLLVNGTTYQTTVFIAPVDGCYLKELWLAAPVVIASGTNTLAVENYDKSASTGLNALSTTTMDPSAATLTAKNGFQLTLSTTVTNLMLDEGDVLWCTLVTGTQGTAGQGYCLQGLIYVPDPL